MSHQAELVRGHGHGHGHSHERRDPEHERQQPGPGLRRRRNDLHLLDVYRCALELYRAIGRIVDGFPAQDLADRVAAI